MNKKTIYKKTLCCIVAILLLCGMMAAGLPQTAQAVTSSFSISGATYPTTLAQGKGFGISGTVTSAATMELVTVGVVSNSTGKWVDGATYSTNPRSKTFNVGTADPYVKFGILPAGSYSYRIAVRDANRTSKYVLIQPFTVTGSGSSATASAASGFSISGATYPTTITQGKGFGISGVVTSTATMELVTVGVVSNSTGKWVSGATYSVNPKSKTFNVSTADPYIKFGTLPAGSYSYRIAVRDVNKTSKYVLVKPFTVGSGTSSAGTSSGSSFSITGATYPTTLKKGQSFSIAGTVSSNVTMERVTVGVVSTSTGKWVSGATYSANPNSKTFNVKTADASIKFGALPEGSYSYRIAVRDTNKTSKYVLNKPFTVGSGTSSAGTSSGSSFSITGETYPTALAKGKSFSLKGTVTSKAKMELVTVGVVSDSTGKWVNGATYKAYPNSTTFNVATADPYIKFDALPEGSYSYRIAVRDTNKVSKYVLNKPFTVGSGTSSTGTSSGSSFSITGETYPTALAKGKSFSLKGTVTSKTKMELVTVGVVSDSTGKWVSGATYKAYPNSTTFNVATADPYIKFGTLPEGSYSYRIAARDVNKTSKYVLIKPFTVGNVSAGGTSVTASMTDAEFKAFLTNQGFPAAYITPLVTLHKAHPSWVFYADNTGVAWSDLLTKEKVAGRNLVEPNSSASYINQSNTTVYDGRWRQASDAVIAYYLDPRNFLTEKGIYQFLDQRSSVNPGTKTQVQTLVANNSCFMNTSGYITALLNAGKNSGVNPAVLASMVIGEQGWRGTSDLISGKNSTYPGIYNHFNVGAYTADGMTAILRGLWWANGAGTGATSFGRPWNSIEKSLTGGASHYGSGYIDNNQVTYYTKKFNVMNGTAKVGSHQYYTNVDGAYTEGTLVKMAYTADDSNLVFRIPVYSGMPASPCPAP